MKPTKTTLSEHIDEFQTCTILVQEFCSSLTKSLCLLHTAGIFNSNIRPETLTIDGNDVQYADFAHAIVDNKTNERSVKARAADRHMLACTILYTLAGGHGTNGQPLSFDALLEATEVGFDDEGLFDQIRAGSHELVDLLRAMVSPDVSIYYLLSRPFFWSRDRAAKFLGEEIGNLLDPAATKGSKQHPFIEALEARGDLELGGRYDERAKQDGPSWAALLDSDYPLEEARSVADGDPTGWGGARNAQQPPHVIEHDFAVYGKKPGAKQKAARESQLDAGKTVQPMASRRMVGLLKTIRNVAFAHRSQHVLVGRFHSEEDVLRYMLDPFPWLLMAVYQLDQEHKIAGSVAGALAKTSDSAATTGVSAGESTSREEGGKKTIASAAATSGDEAAKQEKGKKVKKGKGGHGPKKQDQKDKMVEMLKQSNAELKTTVAMQASELMQMAELKIGDAQLKIAELSAALAQLRGASSPSEPPIANQEPGLASAKTGRKKDQPDLDPEPEPMPELPVRAAQP
jgi:hypothetical protein